HLPFGEAEPGATGLELLLPLALKWGEAHKLPLATTLARISSDPARILGVASGRIAIGAPADLAIFDPRAPLRVSAETLHGPGEKAPPNLAELPDAQPKAEPLHRYANRPYKVFGTDYVPLARVQPFRQRGVASWYGKRFHGQKTASGELYDMYAMTAAHPTLPIPSYARVKAVKTGKEVIVRINDRGPFHSGRVIDLSYAAAYRLGFIGAGSGEVQIEAIVR